MELFSLHSKDGRRFYFFKFFVRKFGIEKYLLFLNIFQMVWIFDTSRPYCHISREIRISQMRYYQREGVNGFDFEIILIYRFHQHFLVREHSLISETPCFACFMKRKFIRIFYGVLNECWWIDELWENSIDSEFTIRLAVRKGESVDNNSLFPSNAKASKTPSIFRSLPDQDWFINCLISQWKIGASFNINDEESEMFIFFYTRHCHCHCRFSRISFEHKTTK